MWTYPKAPEREMKYTPADGTDALKEDADAEAAEKAAKEGDSP